MKFYNPGSNKQSRHRFVMGFLIGFPIFFIAFASFLYVNNFLHKDKSLERADERTEMQLATTSQEITKEEQEEIDRKNKQFDSMGEYKNLDDVQKVIEKNFFTFANKNYNKVDYKNISTLLGKEIPFYDKKVKVAYDDKDSDNGVSYYINDKPLFTFKYGESFGRLFQITTKLGKFLLVFNTANGSCGCINSTFIYNYYNNATATEVYQQWYGTDETYNNKTGEEIQNWGEQMMNKYVFQTNGGEPLLVRLDTPFFSFMGSNPSIRLARMPVFLSIDELNSEMTLYMGKNKEEELKLNTFYKESSDRFQNALNLYFKDYKSYKPLYGDFETTNYLGYKYQLDILAGYSVEQANRNLETNYNKFKEIEKYFGINKNFDYYVLPDLSEIKSNIVI